MKKLKLQAPAKLNLFLRVLRKRPDGYHDLYSLFHKLKLHDELIFKKTSQEGIQILCSSKGFPCDETNLIAKAYRLLKAATGFRGGLRVRVKKRIPIAGGMGGGSSDGAAALLALNRLFHLGLSQKKLAHFGCKLGADIPFFLTPAQSALVSGIGERVKPLPQKLSFHFLIVCFPKGLSTRRVYEALGLTVQKRGARIIPFSARDFDFSTVRNCLKNDLMPVSFSLYPQVKKVFNFIQKSNISALQTGSGPTLFAIHAQPGPLRQLGQKIRRRFRLKTLITQSA